MFGEEIDFDIVILARGESSPCSFERKEEKIMTVVGIQKNGNVSTLHITEEFPSYFVNPESGRTCSGKSVKSVYVGEYDISGIKLGSEIEIFYGEAIHTKNGVYSPIKKIEVLK